MKYMRLTYGEGLRVPKMQNRAWDREKYFYQKSGYARGYIWHHRSNATQHWLFHFLYGGAGKFFVQRWVVDFGFRIWVRLAWLPFTVHFIGSLLGQREYDNNAYDYFYFSDWVTWIVTLWLKLSRVYLFKKFTLYMHTPYQVENRSLDWDHLNL